MRRHGTFLPLVLVVISTLLGLAADLARATPLTTFVKAKHWCSFAIPVNTTTEWSEPWRGEDVDTVVERWGDELRDAVVTFADQIEDANDGQKTGCVSALRHALCRVVAQPVLTTPREEPVMVRPCLSYCLNVKSPEGSKHPGKCDIASASDWKFLQSMLEDIAWLDPHLARIYPEGRDEEKSSKRAGVSAYKYYGAKQMIKPFRGSKEALAPHPKAEAAYKNAQAASATVPALTISDVLDWDCAAIDPFRYKDCCCRQHFGLIVSGFGDDKQPEFQHSMYANLRQWVRSMELLGTPKENIVTMGHSGIARTYFHFHKTSKKAEPYVADGEEKKLAYDNDAPTKMPKRYTFEGDAVTFGCLAAVLLSEDPKLILDECNRNSKSTPQPITAPLPKSYTGDILDVMCNDETDKQIFGEKEGEKEKYCDPVKRAAVLKQLEPITYPPNDEWAKFSPMIAGPEDSLVFLFRAHRNRESYTKLAGSDELISPAKMEGMMKALSSTRRFRQVWKIISGCFTTKAMQGYGQNLPTNIRVITSTGRTMVTPDGGLFYETILSKIQGLLFSRKKGAGGPEAATLQDICDEIVKTSEHDAESGQRSGTFIDNAPQCFNIAPGSRDADLRQKSLLRWYVDYQFTEDGKPPPWMVEQSATMDEFDDDVRREAMKAEEYGKEWSYWDKEHSVWNLASKGVCRLVHAVIG